MTPSALIYKSLQRYSNLKTYINENQIKLNKGLQISKESLLELKDSQMITIKGQGTSGPRCSCRRRSCGASSEDGVIYGW